MRKSFLFLLKLFLPLFLFTCRKSFPFVFCSMELFYRLENFSFAVFLSQANRIIVILSFSWNYCLPFASAVISHFSLSDNWPSWRAVKKWLWNAPTRKPNLWWFGCCHNLFIPQLSPINIRELSVALYKIFSAKAWAENDEMISTGETNNSTFSSEDWEERKVNCLSLDVNSIWRYRATP